MTDRGERLAARTAALVDVPSVSGNETEILDAIRRASPIEAFDVLDDGDGVLFLGPRVRRAGAPFVVLAGHVDTVPVGGAAFPSVRGDGVVVGRGTADMKAGLATMQAVAHDLAADPHRSDLDVGFLFFGREELPFAESALTPMLDRCPQASTVDLAVVMEPTANAIELGCLGNLDARVVIEGRAAHSARPWLGDNAIHAALQALAPLADLPDRDVDVDGMGFREVVNVTTIAGGIAPNVIPDRVEARVNFRYAPIHTPAEAEARMRELLGHQRVRFEVVGNAPPGGVSVANPLVDRLRRAGTLSVHPKQAWTPVAEFAQAGVDAVNFGPGDPQYAHRDDERVEIGALVRGYDVLRAFMGLDEEGAGAEMHDAGPAEDGREEE
jgi:succinyl-diaminopimelate desuccinylase